MGIPSELVHSICVPIKDQNLPWFSDCPTLRGMACYSRHTHSEGGHPCLYNDLMSGYSLPPPRGSCVAVVAAERRRRVLEVSCLGGCVLDWLGVQVLVMECGRVLH